MLVAAFAGYELTMRAYQEAIDAELPVLFVRRRDGGRVARSWSPARTAALRVGNAHACTTRPQTAARISIDRLRARLAEMMVVECPRLLGSRDQRRGAVTIGLALDSSGRVEHASIRRGSGDATFDDLAGGLAARLTLAPDPTVLASYPRAASLTVADDARRSAGDAARPDRVAVATQ